MTQFLKSVYEEKLLKFDFEKEAWHWDINKILEKNITDNVVEPQVRGRGAPSSLRYSIERIRVAAFDPAKMPRKLAVSKSWPRESVIDEPDPRWCTARRCFAFRRISSGDSRPSNENGPNVSNGLDIMMLLGWRW